MKVTERTNSRLCLTEQPWLLTGIVIAFAIVPAVALVRNAERIAWTPRLLLALFVVLMALALRYIVHWVRVEFNRTTGRIRIERRGLMYATIETYPLNLLRSVRLTADSDNDTSRVVLVFDDGMIERMAPGERARVSKLTESGLRTVAANEVALTRYYESGSANRLVTEAIRAWTGLPD